MSIRLSLAAAALTAFLGGLSAVPAAAQTKLLRHPDIAGYRVAFCYAGDICRRPRRAAPPRALPPTRASSPSRSSRRTESGSPSPVSTRVLKQMDAEPMRLPKKPADPVKTR